MNAQTVAKTVPVYSLRKDENGSSATFVGSAMTALVEFGSLPAKLPGARSRRHRLDHLLMPVSGHWWLRRVSRCWWLRGVNDHRVWRGPRVIPGRIDFLFAIGGEQQYREDRAKQHSNGCQDSASSDTS